MHFCNRQKPKDVLTGITLAEVEKKGGQKEGRKRKEKTGNWTIEEGPIMPFPP